MKTPKYKVVLSISLIFSGFSFVLLECNDILQIHALPSQTYTTISVSDAKFLIENEKNLFLLDVRTNSEFDDGHIEGARLIPHDQLEKQQESLPANKSQPMLVYCRSGTRSAIASDILVSLNYTSVYNMDGGFLAWKEANYPYITEKSPSGIITASLWVIFSALILLFMSKKYRNFKAKR
ncbi:MAG: rhodanese-like domain-containing protein [Promethearchaeota archaeon]